jgi:hypothetical protein
MKSLKRENKMLRTTSLFMGAYLIVLLPFLVFSESAFIQKKETQTFQLRYRDLSEVTSKIKPLLSNHGSILIKPHDNQIIIEDFSKNIKAVAKLIKAVDIAPRKIRLNIYFIKASKDSDEKNISIELKEMAAKLGDFLHFNNYQLLDKHQIIAEEGKTSSIQLSGLYIISFYTQVQFDAAEIIKLKNFRLYKREQLADGRYELKKLLVTSINLIDETPSIIGVSSSEKSNKALIMALTPFIEK